MGNDPDGNGARPDERHQCAAEPGNGATPPTAAWLLAHIEQTLAERKHFLAVEHDHARARASARCTHSPLGALDQRLAALLAELKSLAPPRGDGPAGPSASADHSAVLGEIERFLRGHRADHHTR